LGRFGRNRTNIWNYAGASSFGSNRDTELAMHPTVKPLSLVADAILDCSKRGGIVLDAFAGSGTTLIAAEKTGRCGYGIELDPYYSDTILRRFEDVYGLKAVHAESGLEFEKLNTQRSASRKKRHGQQTRAAKKTRRSDERSAAVSRPSIPSLKKAKPATSLAVQRAPRTLRRL
jgi:hypothetical protein